MSYSVELSKLQFKIITLQEVIKDLERRVKNLEKLILADIRSKKIINIKEITL